jgi:alanine racemase
MSATGHRVWADVDLAALCRNGRLISDRVGPDSQLLAVVKADAYGHGAVPVARALAAEDYLWGFGVGDSAEALELRAAGVSKPILILGTIIDDEVPQVVSHQVRVCIHSLDRIQCLEDAARRQGQCLPVHLMVDTGMGRLGAQPPRALELARIIHDSEWLELEGLASHPSPSRPGHPFADLQHERLTGLLEDLEREGMRPPLVHFSNTAAILGGVGTNLSLVRPGISLYGVLSPDLLPDLGPHLDGLQPVLSLRTQVVYLKDVPAGTPVGYNGTHVTSVPTRIATLPVGYNDGLAYRLSNRGRALVRGEPAPIVGAISMDYTTLDVGHIPNVSVGDVVTLIGSDGQQFIGMPEVASLIGTIPYEVSCAVGKRVRRVYSRPERQAIVPRPASSAEDGALGAEADAEAAESGEFRGASTSA